MLPPDPCYAGCVRTVPRSELHREAGVEAMVARLVGVLAAVGQLEQAGLAGAGTEAELGDGRAVGQRCTANHEGITARPGHRGRRRQVAAGIAVAQAAAQAQPALVLLGTLQ